MSAPFILALLLIVAAVALLVGWIMPLYLRNRRAVLKLHSRQMDDVNVVQKKRLDLLETRNRSRVLEDTVKNGASAVELMHRTLTSATFGLIDRFTSDEEFRENARKARETHDQTTEKLYKTFYTTNKAVHLLADSFLTRRTENKIRRRYERKKNSEE